jgi:hypothetical protein
MDDATMHPREIWMWGHEAAIGTSLYWNINHKVFRSHRGGWVPDIPYACGTEAFAREEAEMMSKQTAHDGRPLYQEVAVSGPYVSWREVGWKYRDESSRKAGETRS